MTDEQVLELTDDEFRQCEEDFVDMIGKEMFLPEDSSDARVESILKRAKMEALMSGSTDFVVDSFGRGLLGITDALIGLGEKEPKPRKRSF